MWWPDRWPRTPQGFRSLLKVGEGGRGGGGGGPRLSLQALFSRPFTAFLYIFCWFVFLSFYLFLCIFKHFSIFPFFILFCFFLSHAHTNTHILSFLPPFIPPFLPSLTLTHLPFLPSFLPPPSLLSLLHPNTPSSSGIDTARFLTLRLAQKSFPFNPSGI